MMLASLIVMACLFQAQENAPEAASRWQPPSYDWLLALQPEHLDARTTVAQLMNGRPAQMLAAAARRELEARVGVLRDLLRDRRTATAAPERGLLLLVETLLTLPVPRIDALYAYGVPTPRSRVRSVIAVVRTTEDLQEMLLAALRQSPMSGLLAQFTHRGSPAVRYTDPSDGIELTLLLEGRWLLLLSSPQGTADDVIAWMDAGDRGRAPDAPGDADANEVLRVELAAPPPVGPLTGVNYRCSVVCDGADLVERHELERVGQPLFATGARRPVLLPAQGALLRGSARLTDGAIEGALAAALPRDIADWLPALRAQLTGDVAVGVYPPIRGGMIPRFLLRLDVRSASEVQQTLERLSHERAPMLVQSIDLLGHKGFSFEIPNSPVALAPTAMVVQDQLWIAESSGTLESMLIGGVANEPLAESWSGRPLYFEFDSGRIAALLADTYVPYLVRGRLAQPRPVLDLSLLPRPDQILSEPAPGRMTAWMDGETLKLEQRSRVGGVQNTMLLPIGCLTAIETIGSSLESLRVELERDICAQRLVMVKGALETYRSCFGGGTRYPRSLAELFTRGLIHDRNALLVPSDHAPEVLRYENEQGGMSELPVSYRLVPTPRFTIDSRAVLLYEARANSHGGRFVVFHDGEMYHYSEDLFRSMFGLSR